MSATAVSPPTSTTSRPRSCCSCLGHVGGISSDRFGLEIGVERQLEHSGDTRTRLAQGAFATGLQGERHLGVQEEEGRAGGRVHRLGGDAPDVWSTAGRSGDRRHRRNGLLRPGPPRASAARPGRPHRRRRVRQASGDRRHRRPDEPDQRQRPTHGPHEVRDGAEIPEDTARRVARMHLSLAQEGKVQGRIAYGWVRTGPGKGFSTPSVLHASGQPEGTDSDVRCRCQCLRGFRGM